MKNVGVIWGRGVITVCHTLDEERKDEVKNKK
jgi:hypothetical protein